MAESDLEEIADYIANDNPVRALSFVQELKLQCERISHSPESYRLRPELGDNVPSSSYKKYMLYFEADDSSIQILRVLHAARDIALHFPIDVE